jgi:hypothetical protein
MTNPWRTAHPATSLFPMLPLDEFEAFKGDIKQHGLRQPLLLWGETSDSELVLLDGRNRLLALDVLKIELPSLEEGLGKWFQIETGGDPVSIVVSLNLARRHLTSAQKREVIAKLLKLSPERSDRQLGKDLGVDHKTVGSVRKQSEQGGEIPHQDQRVGSDGKRYPAPAPLRTSSRDERYQARVEASKRRQQEKGEPTVEEIDQAHREQFSKPQEESAPHEATITPRVIPAETKEGKSLREAWERADAWVEAGEPWEDEMVDVTMFLLRSGDSMHIRSLARVFWDSLPDRDSERAELLITALIDEVIERQP